MMVILKEIVSLCQIPSAFLTDAFKGSMYVPDFLSGKIEVFHDVFCIVTATGSDPHPRLKSLYVSCISPDIFLGTVTKCHDAVALGYSHTRASKV